jgi:hypothetical protein
MPVRLVDLVEKFRLQAHEFPDALLPERSEFAGVEKKRKGFVGESMGLGLGHGRPPQLLAILQIKYDLQATLP